jgi:hypothetical protein
MHRTSKLFMVLLVSAGLCAAQVAVPFRLLTSSDSGSTKNVREFDYNVSVDQNLDVSGIRSVICQLIRSQKPSGYEVLSLGIYYKLEQYVSESDRDIADGARHREQRIAQYHWNKDSPKDSRRLVVSKDARGNSLPEWRYYDFDHTKTCRF